MITVAVAIQTHLLYTPVSQK